MSENFPRIRNAVIGAPVNAESAHIRFRWTPMSDAAAKPPSNRAAVIAAPVSAMVLYVVCVTLLLLTLSRAFGGLSRNTFGGAALLWAVYLLPAIVAPAAGALFNALVFGERGRRAAFWPNLALIAAFTVIAVLWLVIAGGVWNYVLAAVQLASGFLAWYLLNRTARGHASHR